jgi:hypothetical protein
VSLGNTSNVGEVTRRSCLAGGDVRRAEEGFPLQGAFCLESSLRAVTHGLQRGTDGSVTPMS